MWYSQLTLSADTFEYDEELSFEFFTKHQALSMLNNKQKRGIVEECCVKPCSRSELSTYCAWVSLKNLSRKAVLCFHSSFQYRQFSLASARACASETTNLFLSSFNDWRSTNYFLKLVNNSLFAPKSMSKSLFLLILNFAVSLFLVEHSMLINLNEKIFTANLETAKIRERR